MPVNYNESQISGTKWTRCHTVVCNNPLEILPGSSRNVIFLEESILNVDGQYIHLNNSGNQIIKEYTPTGSFQILDPATGNPTGQIMSHDELYRALFSLYRQCADERDAASNP